MRVFVVANPDPASRILFWSLKDDGFDVALTSDDEQIAAPPSGEPVVIVCQGDMPQPERRERFAAWKQALPDVKIIDVEPPDLTEEIPEADVTLRMPFHADDLSVAVKLLARGGRREE